MKFEIINLAEITKPESSKVNMAIDLWFEVYSPIVGNALSIDSFQRARTLSLLTENDNIIALSTTNHIFTGLNKMIEHSYFSKCPMSLKEDIKDRNTNIMTVEWITVNPIYQKRFSKISYADLIMGLQILHMKESGFDAAMGFSRIDLKADQIAMKYGAYSRGIIEMFGIECSIIYMPREMVKKHPYLKAQLLIEDLYFNKQKAAKGA